MSFLHPQLLWLLLLPATLLLGAFLGHRRRAAAIPHDKIPRARLGPSSFDLRPAPSSAPRPYATCAALAACVLALARPQGATLSAPAVTETRDVVVAVDVSRSMLADDVAPDRLSRARLLIRTLADELKGERLGLLPFAGTAFLQSPLSADYEIFRTFLDELGPDLIPAGGSDFTALLTAADEAFGPADPSSPDAPAPADRYLIILSDGEAQDDTWKPVAQKLAGRGVRILTLGLGTAAGALVPDGKGGIAKKPDGSAVLSQLNASTLQELARLTDGAYRDASAWVDLPALLRDTVARGRAQQTTTDTAPRREELFTWFLAPALALLALALVREFPATPRPRRIAPPKLPARYAASFLILLALPAAFGPAPSVLAATSPAPETPPPPPPDPLVELVGQLASAAEPAAPDLARLASLTADLGEAARANPKNPPIPEGALRDALAATTQGRVAAPSAADWPALQARLEKLLAPPPEPPKPQKSDQSQKDKNDQKKDPKKDDQTEQKDESKDGAKNESKPDSSESSREKSQGQNSEEKTADSSQTQQASESDQASSPSDKSDQKSTDSASVPDEDKDKGPASSEALGDLGKKPDAEDKPKPDGAATAQDKPPSDEPPTDEPTQRVGGVSASGQPKDGQPGEAAARLDPALAVPQQRLEQVRDADAPARLYQLLQEAENPPDSDRRAAAGNKRDW